MPIQITGEFEPSDGAHGFDLYDARDIKTSNIDSVLTVIAGGRVIASGIAGEIVIQKGAGAPVHSATEGTPYWDTTNNKLYVNNDGSTGWTEIAAGGGVTDHGALTGLGDDDHTQYATNAEFDDHSARHELAGADVISVAGLSGLLATQQTPVNHDHTGDAGDGGQISHTAALTGVGTNTHAQIDTHIAAANPHSGSQPLDGTLTALAGLTITQGSLIAGTGADAFSVLAKGTTLQALCMNVGATAPEWVAVTGTDSVVRATSPTIVTPTIASFANAAHDHSNAAGGGALAAKYRTETRIIYIENPTAADVFPICMIPNTAVMVRVEAITDVGTVTFNIERRTLAQLGEVDGTGTDVLNVPGDLVADATGEATTSFYNSGAITADEFLEFVASAVASSPTRLWVSVELTIS